MSATRAVVVTGRSRPQKASLWKMVFCELNGHINGLGTMTGNISSRKSLSRARVCRKIASTSGLMLTRPAHPHRNHIVRLCDCQSYWLRRTQQNFQRKLLNCHKVPCLPKDRIHIWAQMDGWCITGTYADPYITHPSVSTNKGPQVPIGRINEGRSQETARI
jgi:hypothetical protein